jgi:cellulose synthase/poly-beta-1,6-N-acetylglucosamine synthase-like glycosyltransferase
MIFSVGLMIYLAAHLGYRLLTHVLLIRYVASSKNKTEKLETHAEGNYPGISILIPIKGPVEDLSTTLGSILKQKYPGPLELIIAIRDEDDSAVADSKKVVKDIPSTVQVKWAVGGPASGLNPKNSNLAQAYAQASHSWIYCSDIDTRPEPEHLREMMEISKADQAIYVTSISIHEGPKDLGACLEVFGTNLEATGFFLFAFLNSRCGVLNGASNFFHRSLLEKIGGFPKVVNALTDDLYLGKLFVKAGAEGRLARRFVRVTQDHQTMRGFRERHVRWLMIAKYFRPDLFWPAPFNWAGQWLVLYGLFARSLPHLLAGFILLALRIVDLLVFEIYTGAPREDRRSVWTILVYDFIAPQLWFRAIFRTQVTWGGNVLKVLSGGMLQRSRQHVSESAQNRS